MYYSRLCARHQKQIGIFDGETVAQKINNMKKIIAAIIVAAGATAAFADTSTNITAAAAPPKPKWDSIASLGFTLTRGNSGELTCHGETADGQERPCQ